MSPRQTQLKAAPHQHAMSSAEALIDMHGVVKRFKNAAGEFTVLKGRLEPPHPSVRLRRVSEHGTSPIPFDFELIPDGPPYEDRPGFIQRFPRFSLREISRFRLIPPLHNRRNGDLAVSTALLHAGEVQQAA